jgi:ferric-dicitrate binding protein FerR (iron transport regulator)
MRRVKALAARRTINGRILLSTGARGARCALALLVAAALLNFSAMVAHAAHGAKAHAGEVTFVGGVTIDGSPAVSGQTVFSGSAFATEHNSLSTVSLGTLGRLELSSDTALMLDFNSEGSSCSLNAGRVRVYAPAGLSSTVKTSDVAVASYKEESAVFTVATELGATNVFVQAGRVEVRAGESLRRLTAGQSFSSAPAAQTQQGSGQNLSGGQRKGLFVAIAAAVAVVVIVLTARDDKQIPSSNCVGGPIILSGVSANPCF